MAKKLVLSLKARDKIIRVAGALRISDDAKLALAEALQQRGIEIAPEAKCSRNTLDAEQSIKLIHSS